MVLKVMSLGLGDLSSGNAKVKMEMFDVICGQFDINEMNCHCSYYRDVISWRD